MAKSNIIPIFIAFKGCPHRCVYCEQSFITGVPYNQSKEEIINIIEEQLNWFSSKKPVQVAFYGGSFTAMDFNEQLAYMDLVSPYLKSGKVQSIRCSTRPDAINAEELLTLKEKGLRTIELGIQSTDQLVLDQSGRYMEVDSMYRASKIIKKLGFQLGHQQMIGLPGDTLKKSLKTMRDIQEMAPDFVRIYPTQVFKNTGLEKLYREGKYNPLSLETAIDWVARLLDGYEMAEIPVIRVALPPPTEIDDGFVAGPRHPQFREYAESLRRVNALIDILKKYSLERSLILKTNSQLINQLSGPKKYGRRRLKKFLGFNPKFVREDSMNDRLILELDKREMSIDISTIPWSVKWNY